MADCNNTVDFFKEYDRMCDTFDCDDNCPFLCSNGGKYETCEDFVKKFTDEAVQILQKLSDSHPAPKPKTYADVFFEQHPKAAKSYLTKNDYNIGNAFPSVKRCEVYGIGLGCCMEGSCTNESQMKCWLEPYPGQEEAT